MVTVFSNGGYQPGHTTDVIEVGKRLTYLEYNALTPNGKYLYLNYFELLSDDVEDHTFVGQQLSKLSNHLLTPTTDVPIYRDHVLIGTDDYEPTEAELEAIDEDIILTKDGYLLKGRMSEPSTDIIAGRKVIYNDSVPLDGFEFKHIGFDKLSYVWENHIVPAGITNPYEPIPYVDYSRDSQHRLQFERDRLKFKTESIRYEMNICEIFLSNFSSPVSYEFADMLAEEAFRLNPNGDIVDTPSLKKLAEDMYINKRWSIECRQGVIATISDKLINRTIIKLEKLKGELYGVDQITDESIMSTWYNEYLEDMITTDTSDYKHPIANMLAITNINDINNRYHIERYGLYYHSTLVNCEHQIYVQHKNSLIKEFTRINEVKQSPLTDSKYDPTAEEEERNAYY